MRSLYTLTICLLLTHLSGAQSRISNIRISNLDSTRLAIRYDLQSARPTDSIWVQIRSRSRGLLDLRPALLKGDIGTGVLAGPDRRILWNARANGYALNEEIQVSVLISQRLSGQSAPPASSPAPGPVATDSAGRRRTRYAGPAWALVSLVAPGVGNIFVQTPRPVVGYWLSITSTVYGLLAYGLLERRRADNDYALYRQQKNPTAAEPYYQSANDHHHRYMLTTRAALAITAADVVLTFIRGLRNNARAKSAFRQKGVTLAPGLQAGQPTARLQYSF